MTSSVPFGATVDVGVVIFILLVATLHVIRRDVDPRARGLSAYAVGHFAWLMTAAFATLSISLGVLVFALVQAVPRLGTEPGVAVIALAAVSIAVVGICPMDSGPATKTSRARRKTPLIRILRVLRDSVAVQNRLHQVAAFTFFMASAIGTLLISSGLQTESAWAGISARAMRLAWANMLALIAFFMGARSGGPLSANAGLLQRLCFGLLLLWMLVVAQPLTRAP